MDENKTNELPCTVQCVCVCGLHCNVWVRMTVGNPDSRSSDGFSFFFGGGEGGRCEIFYHLSETCAFFFSFF